MVEYLPRKDYFKRCFVLLINKHAIQILTISDRLDVKNIQNSNHSGLNLTISLVTIMKRSLRTTIVKMTVTPDAMKLNVNCSEFPKVKSTGSKQDVHLQ